MSDEEYVLTEQEQRKVDAALAKLNAAWDARPADADDQPADERLNGPVFVDGAGNLQHEPSPEVAARHAEFLERSEHYARLRAERAPADEDGSRTD